MVAAMNAVAQPTTATTSMAVSESRKRGERRATM